MELAVKAAGWVVGKALGPVTDGLLEAWAASKGLGPNVDELKVELLYAQAMLDNAREREIHSPALKELLQKLRQLAYNADDVLDELEYFRIQDQLDGTYHAADQHTGGCIKGLALNARHTANAITAKFRPSSGSRDTIPGEHNEQDNSTKQGWLSSVCSCGVRTVSSPPPSPTKKDDHKDNGDGKGRRFFCGALPSKVQGCCGKREMSSSPPSPTSQQRDKKFGCGCMLQVTSTACNTAKSIGKYLPCCSSQSDDGNGKRFLSCARRSKVPQGKNNAQAPKLMFDRVKISTKMKDITEHLKPVCAKVSNILNLEFMGTNRITKKDDIAKKRPMTTEYIADDSQLYGRDDLKRRIIDGITLSDGEYSVTGLVVLPIVGPGGIGKTTFTRHVYDEVKSHFGVAIWICVSLNFNASRLAQEAANGILTKLGGEKGNCSDQELIEQKLKGKRFLLVLDDMWECHDSEWNKLLAPFIKGGEKGNVIIVTTRMPKVAEMVRRNVDSKIDMVRLESKDFRRYFEACIFGDQKPWEGGAENLRAVGEQILSKLKGFPLEAKTVGRLLKSQFTLEHWRRVLESKEWEVQTEEDDIMPALKLSYDYLPFHLQQCFYYCALFPEDYEFESRELVHFWIGLDIVHSCDPKNKRIEDVGEDYLRDLTNHGFFKKNERSGGRPYYVIHDLLHNLAVQISSFECLSIHISSMKSIQIPQDVRHLSISVDNKDVEDIKTFKYYKTDLSALEKGLKVENLRTLMVFGEHHESFAKVFCDLLEKARALRAIYLSSYIMEDILCNFSKLIHLRYLRIMTGHFTNIRLPGTISRLYHLKIIQTPYWGCSIPSRHLNSLVNLQHFITSDRLHAEIFNVGNLALLRELRSFEAKKENIGFELKEIAQLLELEVLGIYNLEKVGTKEEADEAKLFMKTRLRELTLHWNSGQPSKDPAQEEQVLESLEPCGKLVELSITGHGGTACPSWLGANISVKNLEFLRLDDVSWKNLPPLGELLLVNEQDQEYCQSYKEQRFTNLKRLELVKIPKLKRWVGNGPCELFSHLKKLIIKDCPELIELPFTHHTGCLPEHEDHMSWFPKLEELEVACCPKLSSLPCIPWSSCTCSAKITQVGSGLDLLDYGKDYNSEYCLEIEGKGALESAFWNVIAFHNLSELKKLEVKRCPPLPVDHLQMLSSLKTLNICDSGDAIWLPEDDDCVGYHFPVEDVRIEQFGGSGERLTHLLSYFPKLRSFNVRSCENLTGLGVVDQQKKQKGPAQLMSSSIDEVEAAKIGQCEQQQGARGEEEISAPRGEELLLLPPQLESLVIFKCPELVLYPDSLASYRDAGRTACCSGGGLQGLRSLRSLEISWCPRLLSSYSSSSSSPCYPFPTSLEQLFLVGVDGMETLLPLSNLTSLADLFIWECGDLRGEGLWPLLAKGRLTALTVRKTPKFFTASEPSLLLEPEFPSSKLHELNTDDVAGMLAAPIYTLLSCSLTELNLRDKKVKCFTKEQEETLKLLTSLERMDFSGCDKLQCVPTGLHRLPNLKRLKIFKCEAIRSLPKDGLPSSLQELEVRYCQAFRSMPKECLPNSLQKLVIRKCPAIRSLPKVDDLPSSLRELDVLYSSNELRRQCRKLIGTIPIVRA